MRTFQKTFFCRLQKKCPYFVNSYKCILSQYGRLCIWVYCCFLFNTFLIPQFEIIRDINILQYSRVQHKHRSTRKKGCILRLYKYITIHVVFLFEMDIKGFKTKNCKYNKTKKLEKILGKVSENLCQNCIFYERVLEFQAIQAGFQNLHEPTLPLSLLLISHFLHTLRHENSPRHRRHAC